MCRSYLMRRTVGDCNEELVENAAGILCDCHQRRTRAFDLSSNGTRPAASGSAAAAAWGRPAAAATRGANVGMHEEREFRSHARPGNHALISGCGQRRATLRDEDIWGGWGFAQELAQRATFPRRYRMHAGIPALGPAYMQASSGEVDVVPAQCHQLRGPKTMAVSDQDSRGVPMPRAVLLGGLDEPLDLPVGEIFTAALANCYIY